jgi:predicted TIM-barrel fold metal-dependent hydrolase
MLIDFSSRPPAPGFNPPAPHLQNYRRVYAASERRSAESSAAADVEAYLATYEALGARHVVLKARDVETTFGFRIANETVADFCRAHGPRYIGFAGVDPHKGKAAVDEFDHAVRNLGLRGLNLQCFELKLRPNDPLLNPLYEKALELDVPVNIHCGINFSAATPMSYGRPEYLDEVMVAFPGLRVCASPPGWPWVTELIGVCWRHPTLYIGVLAVRLKLLAKPHSGYEPLLQYGRTILQDKMIFGSSFPMMPAAAAVEELKALSMEDAVKRKWLHDNAARFLKLADPV